MPPLLQPVTYLSPPKGPALVPTDNETWLGRGSFELSEKAHLLCSRRQACLKITNRAVTLECHGLNPIYFVVCHSVNFQASQDTPPSRLYQLRRGEAVELVDGDKFFLAPEECLLTVAIRPFKSEDDEASEQFSPGAVHVNVLDAGSLAIQACSPKGTQLGQALASSAVQQHRLTQTGIPLSAEVCNNLHDKCVTGDVCTGSPTVHKHCVCSSDASCQCNVVESALAPPGGLQVPMIEDRPVHPGDFSKSGDPTCGEVVIDIRKSEPDVSEISAVSASRHSHSHSHEQFSLDSSRAADSPNPTQAAGISLHGKGCGSSIDASAETFIRNFQPDTVSSGPDSRSPTKLSGNCHSDPREGSKQVSTRDVSDCTSSPPFADRGEGAAVEVVIDTRRSKIVDQIAIVSDGGHVPDIFRSDSCVGGTSINSTERFMLAPICSVEGRGGGSSKDITGEVIVQSIHPDPTHCGLDPRGPPGLLLKSLPPAHDAGEQFINRNVFGHTSSPLSSGPNQVPVITELAEKAGASSSEAILGRHGAAEMLDILMKQGSTEPDSPLKPVPSSHVPPPDGSFSVVPITSCDGEYARELLAKTPEFVDLTISQNDGQNQGQSQTLRVGQRTCNYDRTGPIEGMTKVIVTVSGYEDLVRARLINLISATGAAYTGSLTKMNTHIVCWKFRGAKYEMAKKLGKTIVNHCWFEDSLRAGKRLPEGTYHASGEMSDPLRWDQSVMQYPSSAARTALVIGESSRSVKTAKQSGQSTFSPRSHVGSLDRGKRHVDLTSSANRADYCLDDRQTRALTRTVDSPAVDLSTPNRPREQESDDFWNEVIRACGDKNEHDIDHSCQVLSEAHNMAGLADNRTGRPSDPASPIPGSSLRKLDPYHNEIRSGRRNAIANLAESSRNIEDENLYGATRPNSVVGERADNIHSEVDHSSSYPEVFHRKRKHALEMAKDRSWKSRRLVRKSGVHAASGDLPNQVGNVVGASVDFPAGVPATFNSASAQEEVSTVDTNDDCQQKTCVLAESVSKSGEKGGESAPSSEITCVICHSDTQSVTEGLLACGHQFCYPCIQRWADEAKSRSPTCPLCKVPFDFITFREMGSAGEDGNCAVMEERIVQIGLQISRETRLTSLPSLRTENLCVTCGSRDTPELLLVCTNCRERACHTFCLDPPRPPGSSWFCSRCSQMQSRMQTREAYGRLFHGSSPRSSVQRQGTLYVEMNVDLQSRSASRIEASVVGQSSGTPPRINQAPQSGSSRGVDGLFVRQSSATPPRRGRQYSLHSFLVRQNVTPE